MWNLHLLIQFLNLRVTMVDKVVIAPIAITGKSTAVHQNITKIRYRKKEGLLAENGGHQSDLDAVLLCCDFPGH